MARSPLDSSLKFRLPDGGVVLVGSQDDNLYAVSAAGVLMWYLRLDDDVDAAPSLSASGVLYTASDDQTLRAFQ